MPPLLEQRRGSDVLRFGKCWQVHLLGLAMALAILVLTVAVMLSLTCIIAVVAIVVRGCAICCNSIGLNAVVRQLIAFISALAFIHWGLSAASLVLETDYTRAALRRCARVFHSTTSRLYYLLRRLSRRPSFSSATGFTATGSATTAGALAGSGAPGATGKFSPCGSVPDFESLLHAPERAMPFAAG